MNISKSTSDNDNDTPLARNINLITKGLPPAYANRLYKISYDNALAITDFILSLRTEINLSNHHIMNNIMALTLLSKFHNNEKSFREMTRDDILSYLKFCKKIKLKILVDIDRTIWGKVKDFATVKELSLNLAVTQLLGNALKQTGYSIEKKEEIQY